jgi:membrane associated rhomboid family serine protease
LIDVFHSLDRKLCEDRAFMLGAVSILAEVDTVSEGEGYVVRVPHRQAGIATYHLWQYAQEQRRRSAPVVTPTARFPHAWLGSLVYIAVLVLVALAVVRGWWGTDTFRRGALDAVAIRGGEWWRTVTALTLHLDITHLMSNLGAGAVIGWFTARQLGVGHAWLLTLLAAAVSNLIEGLLSSVGYRSVGASTAVFAALGLLAAHTWRRRGQDAQPWAKRVAPLVAGLALLGMLGTGGALPEQGQQGAGGIDLIAHVLGFVMGVVLGVVVAMPRIHVALRRIPQWVSGLAAIALPTLMWVLALSV